jgi:hypothetical protein
MFFYLTTNVNSREPEILLAKPYVHIKCKTDASRTAIVSNIQIEDVGLEVKTKEEMQAILDSWINEENENPDTNSQGNLVLQRSIDLEGIMGLVNG